MFQNYASICTIYQRAPVAVGVAYASLQLAVYFEVPTIVWLFTSEYVALVTTLSVPIQVLHAVAVVTPLIGPTDMGVVSGHAPDQTVGPGMT